METKVKTQAEIQQEMMELNDQFSAFLHTKGIVAKFKFAFDNMAESTRKQHQADVAKFEEVKAQSAEQNKEFVEFLHTKGIGAKFRLVVENIKKGAQNARQNTAKQIAKVQAQTQANIAKSRAHVAPTTQTYTAESLAKEFNEFLKMKGLDDKYKVEISEE